MKQARILGHHAHPQMLTVLTFNRYHNLQKLKKKRSFYQFFLSGCSGLGPGWQGHQRPRVIDKPVPRKFSSWRPKAFSVLDSKTENPSRDVPDKLNAKCKLQNAHYVASGGVDE